MDIQSKARILAQNLNELFIENAKHISEYKTVHSPIDFGNNSTKYLSNCLDSTWVSSGGKFVNEFSKQISKFTGVLHTVPVSSGTSALRMALISLNVNAGDEVLVPAFTFVASANSISHIGATPNFIDVEYETLGIDPPKLEKYLNNKIIYKNNFPINRDTGAKISALIAVHVYGNSCNIKEISRICEKFNINVIEDCAGALGTFTKSGLSYKHVGCFGKVGCLSFNGNKIITTGGGGAVITNSKESYDKILHLSTTARLSHKFEIEHDEVGWNERMPNINAALGLSQLEIFKKTLKRKKKIYEIYKKYFNNNEMVDFVLHDQYCKSNYWLNSILIKKDIDACKFKEHLYSELNNLNIQIRAGWKPINKLKMYQSHPSDDCSNANSISSRLINLPSNFFLKTKS